MEELMGENYFPRVAIVSCNPMRKDISNGIMMRSLFSSWPQDRLTQIYFPVGAEYPPEFDVCVDYRRISSLGLVHRPQIPHKHRSNTLDIRNNQEDCKSRLRYKMLVALKKRNHVFTVSKLFKEMWYAHSWIGHSLRNELTDCKPDIVYALIGNYSLAKNTCLACRRLGIPLFMHVTDDYVSSLYRSMPLGKHLAFESEKWFGRCIEYSTGRAAISPAMAMEYEARYSKPWHTFTTATSPENYNPLPRSSDGILRFVYAGNLGLNRWRQLRALALALDELSTQSGQKLKLDVYSAQEQISAYRSALEVSPLVNLQGWCPSNKLPQVFHEADVLVHVESFDEQVASLTRLSLSTKLYQYMMAGRCLMGFGPESLASMQFIKQSKAGFVVSTNKTSALVDAIRENCLDDHARSIFGLQARAWAERWGDCNKERERFRQALVEALQSGKNLRSMNARSVPLESSALWSPRPSLLTNHNIEQA